MKYILILFAFLFTISANAQITSLQKDSLATDRAFQTKVRIAAIAAANDLLADTTVIYYVYNYAQLVVTSPMGGDWVTTLTYGVLTNPVINAQSSEGDIQFTVNSIFTKYASAYYRIVKPTQRPEITTKSAEEIKAVESVSIKQ